MPSLRSQASAQQRSSPEHKSYADYIAATSQAQNSSQSSSRHKSYAEFIAADSQAQNPPQERVLAQAPALDRKVATQAQAGHSTQGNSLHGPGSTSRQNPQRLNTYLGRVRALVSPEEFKRLISDHFDDDGMCSITGVVDGVKEPMPYLMENHWEPQYVVECRDKLKPLNGRAPAPGAFILKSIDAKAMEAVGMAFDIDPSMFARHVGPLDAWKNGSAALDQLSSKFSSSLQRPSQPTGHGSNAVIPSQEGKCNIFQCCPMQDFCYQEGVIKARRSKDVRLRRTSDIIWPREGTERIIPGDRQDCKMISRISCLQVSAHDCVLNHPLKPIYDCADADLRKG